MSATSMLAHFAIMQSIIHHFKLNFHLIHEVTAAITLLNGVTLLLATYVNILYVDRLSVFSITYLYGLTLKGLKSCS